MHRTLRSFRVLAATASVAVVLLAGCTSSTGVSAPDAVAGGDDGVDAGSANASATGSWRFVVVGDTHVITTTTAIPSEMIPFLLAENPEVVLVPGDIVDSGRAVTASEMEDQLQAFATLMAPFRDKGIGVYPVRGNHENDVVNSAQAWTTAFSGALELPATGPASETDLTYSFTHKNALFVGIDDYVNIHQVNQPWLDSVFASNTAPHVFVFGHEPAFKDFHTDNLGSSPTTRNTFWTSLKNAGAKAYLCGHDHFFDVARIDDGDGNADNDLYQFTVGTGGGDFPPKDGVYNGDNAPYTPINVHHEVQNGYLLVEISGGASTDLDVTLTFKQRTCDSTGKCTYETTADVVRYTAARK